jgi:peptidoglycan hydrolase CwlO-like protein
VYFPSVQRYLPRSGPGTGQTTKREAALRAEVSHLNAEVSRLTKEQRVQFARIVEIQQELEQIKHMLKKLAGE